jgi:predicted DNA-binding ribbon-helix-helix protein
VVAGHKTSVSLEEAFWSGMKEISGARRMTAQLVSEIDANRNQGNLSSAIRQFVSTTSKSRAVPPIGDFRPRASHAQGPVESPLETR